MQGFEIGLAPFERGANPIKNKPNFFIKNKPNFFI